MNKFGLFVVVGFVAMTLVGCQQQSSSDKAVGDAVKSVEQAAGEVSDAAQAVQAEVQAQQ